MVPNSYFSANFPIFRPLFPVFQGTQRAQRSKKTNLAQKDWLFWATNPGLFFSIEDWFFRARIGFFNRDWFFQSRLVFSIEPFLAGVLLVLCCCEREAWQEAQLCGSKTIPQRFMWAIYIKSCSYLMPYHGTSFTQSLLGFKVKSHPWQRGEWCHIVSFAIHMQDSLPVFGGV